MKKETLKQSLKFTLLSLSAGGIEALSFTLLNLLKLPFSTAHVLSIVLSVLWNFTLNRRYTFKSAGNVPVAMIKVSIFYLFFIPITAYLGQLASNQGINDFIIKLVTMILNFVGEFLWWKFVVFRGTENTNHLANNKRTPSV